MALSVANGWADVKARVKNIGDISGTQQLRVASIINRDIRQAWIDVEPEDFISKQTFSILSDTISYSLPSDFQDILPLECGLFETNDDGEITSKRLTLTGEGSGIYGVWFDGNSSLNRTPKPAASATQILKYIPTIDDFAADTENFVVNERFRELVRAGLLKEYYWQKRRDQEYSFWDSEYIDRLEEFMDKIKRTPNAKSVPDNSGDY